MNILKDIHGMTWIFFLNIQSWNDYPNEYLIFQEMRIEYLKEYLKLE